MSDNRESGILVVILLIVLGALGLYLLVFATQADAWDCSPKHPQKCVTTTVPTTTTPTTVPDTTTTTSTTVPESTTTTSTTVPTELAPPVSIVKPPTQPKFAG